MSVMDNMHLQPRFYLEKKKNNRQLGFAGVYLIFLFLIQNIPCGYSVLTCTHNVCLSENIKNFIFCLVKFQYSPLKKISVLHGHVFVMGLL